MKTELEKFIEWLEGYNEFCYDNSKHLVFDAFGENKVLSESAKKFYSQGLAIERILTRAKEKKLIEAQKDESSRNAEKELRISDVMQQHELLLDFLAEVNGNLTTHPHLQMSTRFVDDYLKSKNCG